MKLGDLGLRGKFVVALLLAAALPLFLGLVLLQTLGYRHLMAERGRMHCIQAASVVRALEQASKAQGGHFRTWLATDPGLQRFVSGVNDDLTYLEPGEAAEATRALDEVWPELAESDSRVRAILGNPGSFKLLQYQALHPEVEEILVTDVMGRLVAATGKATDVDQADEEWWRQGRELAKDEVWIDALKYDESAEVHSMDVITPLHDSGGFAGMVKMSVGVGTLFSTLGFDGEAFGLLWQIMLPDGCVLVSSKKGVEPMKDTLKGSSLRTILLHGRGWLKLEDAKGEERLAGYVALGEGDGSPEAYVIYSSRLGDVVAPLRRNLILLGVIVALFVATCAVGGFRFIDRRILQPLDVLGRAARSISETARLHRGNRADEAVLLETRARAESDLEDIRHIKTGDEVGGLAESLAVMTSRVLRYHREMENEVAAKTAVIREDLELAREFQNALLPSSYPLVPSMPAENPLRLKFSHFYQPASTVGGDFFDLIELDDDCAGVLIADVMGHGARSALVTAILRALVRNHSGIAKNPGDFLTELNQHLHEVISRSGQELFVTAFFLVLDTRNAEVAWAVAGHPAPLRVRRGSGKDPAPLWTEPPRQPALGLVEDFRFHSFHSGLRAGDVFLMYTDGALEAENPAGEPFGVKRLISSFDEALDGPMAAMPAKIVCDVTAFQKRKQYDDDVCLVAVEACREG